MKVTIQDVHDSHGVTFTLCLDVEENNGHDKEIMQFLNECLRSVHKKVEGLIETVLCTYGIVLRENGCDFELVDAGKRLAKVDGLWNSRRRDQKFVVILVEGDDYLNYENPAEVTAQLHELCYYCGKKAYTSGRTEVTIYDTSCEPPKKRFVLVHDMCEEERQIKIAHMFPYQNPLQSTGKG